MNCSIFFTAECNLRIENIPEICEAMYGARLKWYEIGMFLQFGIGTLDAIKTDEKETNKCFLRMLIRWLQIGKNTTWNALADALRSKSVDCPDIAGKIHMKKINLSTRTIYGIKEISTKFACLITISIWKGLVKTIKQKY